jgi:hypothetical protein
MAAPMLGCPHRRFRVDTVLLTPDRRARLLALEDEHQRAVVVARLAEVEGHGPR